MSERTANLDLGIIGNGRVSALIDACARVVRTCFRASTAIRNQAALADFRRVADIGLVTPLHDGMNLVAKQFVARSVPMIPAC